jgi:integrase
MHPRGAKRACEEALCWLREQLLYAAATLLLASGIHPKVVLEMLGHADVVITLKLYSHVLPHMQREAAAAMEATLLGDTGD